MKEIFQKLKQGWPLNSYFLLYDKPSSVNIKRDIAISTWTIDIVKFLILGQIG